MHTREEIQRVILKSLNKGENKRKVKVVESGGRDFVGDNEIVRVKEDEGVWVGLKISEEGEDVSLREILGNDYRREDIVKLKRDKGLYKEFELLCWEHFIGQEVMTEDNLYQMLEVIMDVKRGHVVRAKVDSTYNENDEEVYVSYKVKVIT